MTNRIIMTIQWLRKITNHSFLYLLLLPVFFTLHGWNESFAYLQARSVVLSFIIACALTGFFFVVGRMQSVVRRAVVNFAFLCTAVVFFYPVADNDLDAATVFTKPLVAAMAILTLFVFLLFLLRAGILAKLGWGRYLNILFLILVAVELFQAGVSIVRSHSADTPVFFASNEWESKNKFPPIYIILLDEYAGANALQRTTGYDNRSTIEALQQMGFYVAGASKSNYDYTILSLASMFNGMYNDKAGAAGAYDNANYKPALNQVYNNRFFNTLQQMGYKAVNLSPLDMSQQRRFYHHIALPGSDELIFQSTILWQAIDLFPLFFARRLPGDVLLRRLVEYRTQINTVLLDSVLALAQQHQQVVCYTHLMMPHAIYARDSSGQIATAFLRKKSVTNLELQDAYLQYFKYANTVILPFTKQLIEKSNGEAIIVLLSDHGSRHLFTNNDAEVSFENLLAVYYPSREYSNWYPDVSNVNVMRILLSDLTGKPLPLLKDSLVLK